MEYGLQPAGQCDPRGRVRPGFAALRCRWLGLALVLMSTLAQSGWMEDLLQEVARLESSGEFTRAETQLREQGLKRAELSPREVDLLKFEHDRFRRIRRDFRRTRAEVYDAVQAAVRDLTPEEFERWTHEGRFDIRRIDGEERFFVSSLSNLFFRHPELEARRLKPKATAAMQEAYWENANAIRRAALAEGRPYVLPKRFLVRMSLEVATNAVSAVDLVSAWLPVPRRYPFQDGFELRRSSSPVRALEPEDSPIRSVHLEQPARPGGGTRFEIEYFHATRGVWFDLDPGRWRPPEAGSALLKPYLGESPHVRFTDPMKRLAAQVGGGETNGVQLARRCFRWISGNFHYSYAPEYSTLRDLAEVCRAEGRGDCGQVALLFITLCRINGVPARWQSGWAIFPGDETIHDWCEIYLEPWGWVPADPYMGLYAMRYATHLSVAKREELRDFYLGGLCQYRISANSDHNQELRPTKKSIRSDPVDFQRGEVEVGSRNLYFDEFDYDLQWEELPAGGAP